MRSTTNRPASGSIATNRHTDVGQSSTVQKKAKEKKTARNANKTISAPLQELAIANKDAEAEIARLRAQLAEAQHLQKEAEDKFAKVIPHVAHKDNHQDTMMIQKPKGEAGNKKRGFNLREAMKLDDIAQKDLYDAIQRSVRTNAIRAGLDFAADYRMQDPAKLANVFKMTRKEHPYMTKKRFPADWSAAEMLKQYMKNHRRHAVRNGRMERRAERKMHDENNGDGSGLHNVDRDDSDNQDNEEID